MSKVALHAAWHAQQVALIQCSIAVGHDKAALGMTLHKHSIDSGRKHNMAMQQLHSSSAVVPQQSLAASDAAKAWQPCHFVHHFVLLHLCCYRHSSRLGVTGWALHP
jgi:hypothetical protein